MDIITAGFAKAILEKLADPIINKIANFPRDEWEKFKVDFDFAFSEYLKNSYDKYSKIKTILYRTEPKNIYDFFEIPTLEKENNIKIQADSVDKILNVSKFVIIQGTGGIGKSTLMKHLFINELLKKNLIPIFIELKELNDISDEYEINDLIFKKLNDLGSTLKKEYMEYALKSGCFLFLLDGYDEILSEKKDKFFKKFDAFCDRYSDNYFVISSRPYSEFIEFQRFTVLKTLPLKKEQAVSLISKIDFDKDIKQRFIVELENELYEKHYSFASNPLLLNIMLLTFDNYAEIPEKLHLFYSNAFETLYSRHDATKAGYKREMKSKLSYDNFRKVFSYFCYITYIQGKNEFSYDELVATIKKIKIENIEIDVQAYIYDLVNSLCVLYKDGLNYRFSHRSFQEYFMAVFLKDLTDDNMKKISLQVINKDVFRATHDDVFAMLFDMVRSRFEKNILLPILEDFEKDCIGDNKYNYYLLNLFDRIAFENISEKGKVELIYSSRSNNSVRGFIDKFLHFYRKEITNTNNRSVALENNLLDYLTKNRGYEVGDYIEVDDIFRDKEVYELVKSTWIGDTISVASNLSIELQKRQRTLEDNLLNILK